MSAPQPTGEPLTGSSRLSFVVDGRHFEVDIHFLDVMSYVEKAEHSSIMEPELQAQIIARCHARYQDPPRIVLQYLSELGAIRNQLWGFGSSKSTHDAVAAYRARWNGVEHEKIKKAAKEKHDSLLQEWYKLAFKACPFEEALEQKDILDTILMAGTWLRMSWIDIAITLTYLCSLKYRSGGFYFRLDNDFRPTDVAFLYEYTQSFLPDDFRFWVDHGPAFDATVEREGGEWNQRLLQMPWIKAKLDYYETEEKIYRDAGKVGGYKLFLQWFEIAREWDEKRQQQP
ncbi:MAG: hypothetical protein Q9182_002457 [Xanthomendoza sp. 2 TL-2023]